MTADPKQIILCHELNVPPGADYKVYAIILYEEEVKYDTVGNETIFI